MNFNSWDSLDGKTAIKSNINRRLVYFKYCNLLELVSIMTFCQLDFLLRMWNCPIWKVAEIRRAICWTVVAPIFVTITCNAPKLWTNATTSRSVAHFSFFLLALSVGVLVLFSLLLSYSLFLSHLCYLTQMSYFSVRDVVKNWNALKRSEAHNCSSFFKTCLKLPPAVQSLLCD